MNIEDLDDGAAEIDRSYQVFDDVPLDTEDDWGDLAGFLEAACGSCPRPSQSRWPAADQGSSIDMA